MEKKIKEIIAGVLNVEVNLIDDFASMNTLKNWDSLNHMNIILAIEEDLGVTFDDEQMLKLTSYSLILKAVKQKKKGN